MPHFRHSHHGPPALDDLGFRRFLVTLANTSDAPAVISSSYGEDEDDVPEAYADRVNAEFMKVRTRLVRSLAGTPWRLQSLRVLEDFCFRCRAQCGPFPASR